MSKIDGYARFRRPPDFSQLAALIDLVGRLREAEADAERKEQELAAAAAAVSDLRSKIIPAEMERLQVNSQTLPDGTIVTIRSSFVVSPKKENRPEVAAWVRSAGGEPLLSHTVTVDLPKGQSSKPIEEAILLTGYSPSVVESIHPSTLRAFVTDRIENGISVPEQLLGVFQLREAVLTVPVFDGE